MQTDALPTVPFVVIVGTVGPIHSCTGVLHKGHCATRAMRGILNVRTLRAIEQPNKTETRPDRQEIAQIADGAADRDENAKADGEHCHTYQATSRNQRGHRRFLPLLLKWL